MEAKVHYETRHTSGSIRWEAQGQTFNEWCESVGVACTQSNGLGLLIGDVDAIPLGSITRIEKLED